MHDAESLITMRTMPHDCQPAFESVLSHVPMSGQWVSTTRDGICAIDVDNRLEPPGTPGGPALPVEPGPIALETTGYLVLPGGDSILAQAIDYSRDRLYAAGTGSAGPQLAVVALSTDTVVTTVPLPAPTAPFSMTLNDDGTRLYLGYAGVVVDRIDVFDTQSFAFLAPIPYSPDLIDNPPGSGSGALSDVRWIGADRLLLAPLGNTVTSASVAMIDVASGEASRIAGGESVFFGDARFAVAADLTAAILGARQGGSQRLIRIDLSLGDPDIANERDHAELDGARNVALSADGEILYIEGGKAVDARTLMLEGKMIAGMPLPTPDQSLVHMLDPTSLRLQSYDASTYQLRAIYDLEACGHNGIHWASLAPDGRKLIMNKGPFICHATLPAGP
jgi:hypothetical protein